MGDEIKVSPTRDTVAQMNVAIYEALGIDPTGIVSMTVMIIKDEAPRIEVTYSARFIAELEMPRRRSLIPS